MISEIDINDMKELYKLNQGDHFKIVDDDLRIPPSAPEVFKDLIYKFLKVDGMYAQIKDSTGMISFVAAWTKVKKVEEKQMHFSVNQIIWKRK